MLGRGPLYKECPLVARLFDPSAGDCRRLRGVARVGRRQSPTPGAARLIAQIGLTASSYVLFILLLTGRKQVLALTVLLRGVLRGEAIVTQTQS